MPRDSDKNNDSRGRRDRPIGGGKGRWRQGPLGQPGDPRRNSPSVVRTLPRRILLTRAMAASGVPMPESPTAPSPTAPSPMAKSPIRAPASPMPASATAPRLVSTGTIAPRGEKRPYTPRGDRAMPARPRGFPTGNSATRNLTHRAKAAARNGPIRRAAKASARTATGRADAKEIARTAPGRRVTATVRAVIVPSGNSAATRSFRAARRTAVRARILAAGIATAVPVIAAIQSRGRSVTPARPITPDAIRARRATAPEVSTSRVSKSRVMTSRARIGAATSARGFRVHARIARRVTSRFERSRDDRPKFDRPRQRPEGRTDWQEHPRSEGGFSDRPRRDNEDDSKVFAKRPAFGGRGEYRERKPDFEKRAATAAARKEIRRAHRQGGVARRSCLAPRCRGMDRAGPRHGQWPRDQFAGARCHSQRCRGRRRQAVAAARTHPAVHVSQAARLDDDACRSRKAGRRCSTICRRDCRG